MDYTWKKKPNEIKQNMFSETDGASNNAFEKRSVMYIADKVTAPLLILHGEKDEVISVDQAYSMQKKMRELGKESELVTFKEKGHHLSGPELRNEFVLPFIEKHL